MADTKGLKKGGSATQSTQQTEGVAPVKGGSSKGKVKLEFPRHRLMDALKVAQALEAKNGGLPLPPTDTAIAVGMSPGSSTYRDLLSSSIRYGLTNGSWNGERITLTTLGEEIVRPRSEQEVQSAMVVAALKPAPFAAIFEYLKGKKLPDPHFFRNTLARDFGIPAEYAQLCAEIFIANAEHLGLVRVATTGKWLASDMTTVHARTTEEDPDEGATTNAEANAAETSLDRQQQRVADTTIKNAVFIGHGKNHKPLDQLKAILTQLGIPYKVAQEEPNVGRPISTKVADTLDACGAAILIFTADEEFRDVAGNVLWRPRENVIHELGAASVLYGNRIIIFKEQQVNLASNFKDIGYIEFEKDRLSDKMPDLLRELIAFNVVRLTIGGN